jgi:hypothetical protein
MINYENLILPPLPGPWKWEKGKTDGDPQAVLEKEGWRIIVYETVACRYTENLSIYSKRVKDSSSSFPPMGIPCSVFNAVNEALRQWYEVEKNTIEKLKYDGIAKTVDAYAISLDEQTCDEDGCNNNAQKLIVYRFDNGQYLHHLWCKDHYKVLSPGSVLIEEDE